MKYLIFMAVLLTGCGENDPARQEYGVDKETKGKD